MRRICPICLEDLVLQSITLPCSHRIHRECKKLLVESCQFACPICKQALFLDSREIHQIKQQLHSISFEIYDRCVDFQLDYGSRLSEIRQFKNDYSKFDEYLELLSYINSIQESIQLNIYFIRGMIQQLPYEEQVFVLSQIKIFRQAYRRKIRQIKIETPQQLSIELKLASRPQADVIQFSRPEVQACVNQRFQSLLDLDRQAVLHQMLKSSLWQQLQLQVMMVEQRKEDLAPVFLPLQQQCLMLIQREQGILQLLRNLNVVVDNRDNLEFCKAISVFTYLCDILC